MNSLLSTKTSTTKDALPEPSAESDLAPLLTAWELAHSTATDPDWRHLLDELAHPDTTQAFHRLAAAAA
ncbi:hypothetical protein [Streptomyces vastus]|uniref:Uncharacterized protein n=1 Tax=Streptomyces vastus TaxID=285451 RepID=A0ABP6DB83_9ACTN